MNIKHDYLDNFCCYCEKKFDGRNRKLKPTTDHIIPRSRGGNNSKANKCTCCSRCNSLKGSLLPSEIVHDLKFYLAKGILPYNRIPKHLLAEYSRDFIIVLLDNMESKDRRISYSKKHMIIDKDIGRDKNSSYRNVAIDSDEHTEEYKKANAEAIKRAGIFWNTQNFHC